MKEHFISVTAALVLVTSFFLIVYRAIAQPIAHDEALTFVWFIDGGVYKLLFFNGNNHVLFTLIAKFVVKLFGVTEFSLRGPSVMGAAAYLSGMYLLCKKVFGIGISFLLVFVLVSVNPQILDFMTAARGYGLGLACLSWGLYFLLGTLDQKVASSNPYNGLSDGILGAIFLALAIVSNLTNLIPVCALTLSFYLTVIYKPGRLGGRTDQTFAFSFLLPMATTALFFLWPFLIQARPANFAFGLHASADFLRDEFNSSFLYRWLGDIYSPSLGALAPRSGSWQYFVSIFGAQLLIPLYVCLILIGDSLPSRGIALSSQRVSKLFVRGAMLSICLTLALHVLLRANYPPARAGLYFIVLFTFCGALTAKAFSVRYRWFKPIAVFVACLVICNYLACIHFGYFRYNAYDAVSRKIFLAISTDAKTKTSQNVRVGGTWWYQPELDFYRVRYKADLLLPYDIKDESYSWQSSNALKDPGDYDYFVFTESNDPHLPSRIVFTDKQIGVTVISRYK